MTTKDDAWLEGLLRESAQDEYLADDGFSVAVMNTIAESEVARFTKVRRILFGAFALMAIMLTVKFFSLSSVVDVTQYLFSDVAVTTLIPAALVAGFLAAGGVLNLIRE